MSTTPIHTSPFGAVAFDDGEKITVYTFPLLPGNNASHLGDSYFIGVRDSAEAKISLQAIRHRLPVFSQNQPSIQFTSHPQTIATVTQKFLGLSDTPDTSQVTLIEIESQKQIGNTYSVSNQCLAPGALTYAGITSTLGDLRLADDTLGLKVALWAADRSVYTALKKGIESTMDPSRWAKLLKRVSR